MAEVLFGCTPQYNGCKWRGGVLKVDVAQRSYKARLRDIWDAVEEDDADAAAVAADAEAGVLRHVLPPRAKPTIKLMRRDGRKVQRAKLPGITASRVEAKV